MSRLLTRRSFVLSEALRRVAHRKGNIAKMLDPAGHIEVNEIGIHARRETVSPAQPKRLGEYAGCHRMVQAL